MSWLDVQGHDDVADLFRRALAQGRLAGAYLFVGPPGVGKRLFALRLAQTLLCQARPAAEMNPCGRCYDCLHARSETHADLLQVRKPDDKSAIPLALLIGDGDNRMRAGLCYDIAFRPHRGHRRVGIIDDADWLNEEGSNSLLKTLEEPPPHATLILLATNLQRQLPTIRSRSQIVRFKPLPAESVAEILVRQRLVEDPGLARAVAEPSGGSLVRAQELADPELWEFYGQWLPAIADAARSEIELTAKLGSFLDSAGEAAPLRRARFRSVLAFTEGLYRQVLRGASGLPLQGDEVTQAAARRALESGWDAPRAAAAAERCLQGLTHIDANANQAALVALLVDDLLQLARGQ